MTDREAIEREIEELIDRVVCDGDIIILPPDELRQLADLLAELRWLEPRYQAH